MSVGADVAAARRAAGLTIDDVSAATRVRATVVRSIEADDFSLCGGRVYARGHLRAICDTVGLDPVPVLAAFDAEQGVPEPPVASGVVSDDFAYEPRRLNWSVAMAVALVAVLGFVGFRFLTVGGPASSAQGGPSDAVAGATASVRPSDAPTSDPTSEPATESSSAPSVTSTPDALPSDAVAAGPAVQVVVSTVGARSWLQVKDSGGVTYQGVLEKGESRRFVDSEKVSLVIGNAGAVTLKVNGEDLGQAGSSGQVARLSFGPGNPNQG